MIAHFERREVFWEFDLAVPAYIKGSSRAHVLKDTIVVKMSLLADCTKKRMMRAVMVGGRRSEDGPGGPGEKGAGYLINAWRTESRLCTTTEETHDIRTHRLLTLFPTILPITLIVKVSLYLFSYFQ